MIRVDSQTDSVTRSGFGFRKERGSSSSGKGEGDEGKEGGARPPSQQQQQQVPTARPRSPFVRRHSSAEMLKAKVLSGNKKKDDLARRTALLERTKQLMA